MPPPKNEIVLPRPKIVAVDVPDDAVPGEKS